MCHLTHDPSWTQPGSSPVSPLGVVPDFISSFHPNPLGNGTILLLFLAQESLDPESLVRRHGEEQSTGHTKMAEKRREKASLSSEVPVYHSSRKGERGRVVCDLWWAYESSGSMLSCPASGF